MNRKSFLVFLFLLPFAKLCAVADCDTLFTARKAGVIYSTNLDTLGFDSTEVLARFHQPEGYLFYSTIEDQSGYHTYRLVFREGKRWKSWDAELGYLEFGSFYTRWKQVDGCGRSELLIFWCVDFGHHSATHGEERSDYSLDVWSIDSAKLVLSVTYRTYSWWADMDFGSAPDSTGTPYPPSVDEQYDIGIGNGFLFTRDHSRVKAPWFPDQQAQDSAKNVPEAYHIGRCGLQEGYYKLENGAWVKKTSIPQNHSPVIHPPRHEPYWNFNFPGLKSSFRDLLRY